MSWSSKAAFGVVWCADIGFCLGWLAISNAPWWLIVWHLATTVMICVFGQSVFSGRVQAKQ
jgi:hypothetical protein